MPALRPPLSPAEDCKIYLADDHQVLTDALRVLIEAEPGLRVIGTATDGRTAVRELRGNCADVVIFDVAMPELNGISATVELLHECPNVRVIILSMYASSEHIYRALKAGAMGYLVKENAGREVVEAIKTVAKGHRFLSALVADQLVDDYVRTGHNEFDATPLERLSEREREILQLVVEGHSSADIGKALFLSPKTVDTYRSRLMSKLGFKDMPTLVKFAVAHGLTPPQARRVGL